MGAKKPNYVLYGGIAISAIILYKLFNKKSWKIQQ
jgi:hypothetical protein